MRTKICHVFGYGPDKLGSMEGYMLELQKQCNERDIDLTLVFTREPINEFKALISNLNGKYIVINHDKKVLNLKFINKLIKYFKKNSFDIIHSHFDSANLNVAIAASHAGCKKVFWHQRNVFGTKLLKLRNCIYRKLSKRVTNIIAVSKAVESDLINRGINSKKVCVLYDGIDVRPISLDQENFKEEIGVDKNKYIILTVAQARPEKDLNTLIKAIKEVKNSSKMEFVIVGGGPLIGEIKSLAENLEIKNIHFLDKRNDIREVMIQSDIFVLTSKKDALPNVILEAMANKIPIISTNAGGIPELVINNKTGILVEIGDYKSISKSIDNLYEMDTEEKYKLVESAYNHILNNFNLEKIIKITIEDLYNLGLRTENE